MSDLIRYYEKRLPVLQKMGGILNKIIKEELHNMLDEKNIDDWKSLDILYHPPRVERLYQRIIRENENFKLSNHYIHPEENLVDCLMHPHPRASVIEIIEGKYEMGIGYGDPNGPTPEVFMKTILSEGSSYEMLHPYGWHYVKPLTKASKSVMLMAEKWPEDLFTLEQEFDLSANKIIKDPRKLELMGEFRDVLKKAG